MKSVEKAIARRDVLLKWLFWSNILVLLVLTTIISIYFQRYWVKEGFLGVNLPLFILPIWIFLKLLILQRLFLIFVLFLMSHIGSVKVCEKNFEKTVGKYKVQDIYEMVDRLAKQMGVKSIKGVYITKSVRPNAMTSDTIAFRPLRRSIVIIFSNVLEFMNEKEVEAVIAHEIGHIKNEDTRNLIYVVNPSLIMGFIVLVVMIDLPLYALYTDISPDMEELIFTLITALMVYGMLSIFIRRLQASALMRNMENLADYEAVKHVGLPPTANALIQLGQRMENVLAYTKGTWQYKIKKINKQEWEIHNKKMSQIKHPDQIMDYVRENLAEKDKDRNPVFAFGSQKHTLKKVRGQVVWKAFDTRSPWDWLDYEELGSFVGCLKNTRFSRIFPYEPRTIIGKSMRSHPTIEDRIIFVWDNIHLEAQAAGK